MLQFHNVVNVYVFQYIWPTIVSTRKLAELVVEEDVKNNRNIYD